MSTPKQVKSIYLSQLDKLILVDQEYQRITFSSVDILNQSIEYTFLEGYKCWENFIEDIFISCSQFKGKITTHRAGSYLKPKNDTHALDLLKLEKDYIDWTNPENIISRAEICFLNHQIITACIKLAIRDLRDSKKLRNCIAHGSKESLKIFNELCRNNIGNVNISPGEYLNTISPDAVNNYNVYYLSLFKNLINTIIP
jgi:hypothetical protein